MTYKLLEKDLKSFFEVPFLIYQGTPYVSPFKDDIERFLDERKNPLFSKYGSFTFFTVFKNNQPCGRIVVHIHKASNERHHLKQCYFGFFDCADDSEAAKILLSAAEDWGRKQGMIELIGNFNLTAMQQIGVVTDGFENAPYCDQMWNPEHIPKLLSQHGFTATFPTRTFEIDLRNLDVEAMRERRIKSCLDDPEVKFVTITKNNLKTSLEDARLILNAGFDKNPMFVPVTKEEFDFQAKDMMLVLDPRISTVALDHGKPAGVVVCIPDLNPFLKSTDSRLKMSTPYHYVKFRMNRKRAVIIYYSVDPVSQGKGINGAMLYHVLSSLKKHSYETLGITWIADVNVASLRQMEKYGARVLHKLNLFRKDLHAPGN